MGVVPFNQQPEEPWGTICHRFQEEFGDHAFQSWVGQLGFCGVTNGVAELVAPTKFVRDWIQRHYASRLKDYFNASGRVVHDLHIHLAQPGGQNSSNGAKETVLPAVQTPASANAPTGAGEDGLDPRYTFDSFVIGKSNELAYHAARRVSEHGAVTFNPLFLHGGVGLGKTHLLHAIAWRARALDPGRRITYISAEKFMFEFIAALRFKDTHAFKRKFRNTDLLMVDDVQFLANKDSTQEEFFHTFNALIDNRCQLVISADRAPSEIDGIQDRIVSRLGWGLVADIHPTDFELRHGILQSKAAANPDVEIPGDVIDFLARRIVSNVRELEGAFNRVTAYAMLVGRAVTVDLVRDLLQDLIRANDRRVSVDEIQRAVAEYYHVRLAEMLSARRARTVVRPRQIAMYLAKKLTANSLPEIGRRFGGRDHTTVMHAVKKVEDLRCQDSALEDDLLRLMRLLER